MDTKKALLVKTFRDFNNNHSFPQSQQQTRSTDIQEKDPHEVNLLYFAGTSENIVPFWQPKDGEIDFSNCKVVYFGESKPSLRKRSDDHKRSVKNCNGEEIQTAKQCWEADHNVSLISKENCW